MLPQARSTALHSSLASLPLDPRSWMPERPCQPDPCTSLPLLCPEAKIVPPCKPVTQACLLWITASGTGALCVHGLATFEAGTPICSEVAPVLPATAIANRRFEFSTRPFLYRRQIPPPTRGNGASTPELFRHSIRSHLLPRFPLGSDS